MNPDKLFDYLDGRLSVAERTALEEQLISDRQLQRELAVARRIHAGMHGDSREVLLPSETDVSKRGRKMALRVGVAFIVLMAVNVGVGLWLIARHETKNPNRALLETQMRQQLAKSLEHAAEAALTPAPLGVSEITIAAAGDWMTLRIKSPRSLTGSVVPRPKDFRTRIASVFWLMFHRIAGPNLAPRLPHLPEELRTYRRPRLMKRPRRVPRKRASLCKLSSLRQSKIDRQGLLPSQTMR